MKLKNIYTTLTPKLRIRWRDLLFLAIGAIIATVLNNWTYFTFNKEISISDLFTGVVGAYIGIYIGTKLSSKASSERIEKDLIISEINIVRSSIFRLSILIEAGSIPLHDAVSLIKNSRQGLTLIKELVTICVNGTTLMSSITNTLRSVSTLNNSLTGPTASINNGTISLNPQQITSLSRSIKTINKSLLQLVIKANRVEN